MAHAAKVLALVSWSVVSVSTKLSIAAVLGLAGLPLLPNGAASRLGASAPQPPATIPVAFVPASPTPVVDIAPGEPQLHLVARRRARREPPETREPEHKNSAIAPAPEGAERPAAEARPGQNNAAGHGKTSSIAPPEPEKASVAPAEAAPAEPPKPEVWSDAEIITALRECVRLLSPISGEVEVAQPVKHKQCGAPAPVLLKRVGSGANRVEINPPAELNCAMVVSLHTWVEKTLQPAAREALGAPIARLRNASGYVCRARNGHPLGTDKLSEHALANAIDIAGFVTGDGRTVDVARAWGPTERDRREAARLAAAAQAKTTKDNKEHLNGKDDGAAEGKSGARAEPAKIVSTGKKISLIAQRPEEPGKLKARDAKSQPKTAALEQQGKGALDVRADPKAIPATGGPERDDAKASVEAQFLRRLHKGACGVFGTVLGPEANELHRDHFHFDLATRRYNALCQ
jgi:hypothetical protein